MEPTELNSVQFRPFPSLSLTDQEPRQGMVTNKINPQMLYTTWSCVDCSFLLYSSGMFSISVDVHNILTLYGNGIEGTIERLWGILCKNSFHDLLDHNFIFNPGIRSSNIYCSFCVSRPVLTNYKDDPLSFSFYTWSIQRFTHRGSLKSWSIDDWIFIIRSGCWWIRHRRTLRVCSVF